MTSHAYTPADASRELFARYLDLIDAQEFDPMQDDQRLALENLAWICREGMEKSATLPLDKISRWLGFVQGCLAMRGLVSVDEERDISRPMFHRAYRETGCDVPGIHSRVMQNTASPGDTDAE